METAAISGEAPAANPAHTACGVQFAKELIITEIAQLYGWDARLRFWHGPDELNTEMRNGTHRLADTLRRSPGNSWFGPVQCAVPGEPAARFFAVAQDLGDAAVATLYCNESKTGPAEIVAVLPAERRARLRPEFAFEFMAFANFLGSAGAQVGLEIHNRLDAALAETAPSDSLVFSIGTGLWAGDADHMLSICVEKVAIAMLHWRTGE